MYGSRKPDDESSQKDYTCKCYYKKMITWRFKIEACSTDFVGEFVSFFSVCNSFSELGNETIQVEPINSAFGRQE